MSNPDNKVTTSTVGTFGLSIPLGIFYGLLLFILFLNKSSIPHFNLFLWAVFPVVVYLMGFAVNIINQYVSCNTIDAGKAFLGSIPSTLSVIISMGFATFSYCRIPVTSVFAPFTMSQDVDVISNNSTTPGNIKRAVRTYCCPEKMTLAQVEDLYPQLTGISYAFYVFFGVLFGTVFGAGLSSIC